MSAMMGLPAGVRQLAKRPEKDDSTYLALWIHNRTIWSASILVEDGVHLRYSETADGYVPMNWPKKCHVFYYSL